MNNKVRLPSGEVVPASDLPKGEQCARCDGFIPEAEKEPTHPENPHIFRFEHQGFENNSEPNDRVVSPHRSGFLCPDCEDEFRREFLGDEYEGEHQVPNKATSEGASDEEVRAATEEETNQQ